MKTIALIDDRPLVRLGFFKILKDNFDQLNVLESSSPAEFVKLNPKENPELVLLNMSLGNSKDCVLFAKQTKEYFPLSRIVVYADYLDPSLISSYFRIGIGGVLSSKTTVNEFTSCINTIMSGKPFLNQDLFFTMMHFWVDKKVTNLDVESNLLKVKNLAKRERQIAGYLSQGMTPSQIAKNLGLQFSTVSTIKKKIFIKTGVTNVLELKELLDDSLRDIG